jgi:hypothetical protein
MERDVWTPIVIGLACTTISTFISILVPETLHLKHMPALSRTSPANVEAAIPDGNRSIDDEGSVQQLRKVKNQAISWLQHIRQTTKFVLSDMNLSCLVITFLIADFGRQSLSFLLQYVSERYSLPLAKV